MRASWAALALLVASLPVEAFGGDGAERLFREGVKLEASNKLEQACPKFEASLRARASSEVELALGKCYERLKRTASAWNAYNTAIALARQAQMPDQERVATSRAAALEPWLSRVTLYVPDSVTTLPDFHINADGAPLQTWTDVPMDPGNHVIEVSAAGKKPFQRTLEVRQSEGLTTATIPQLEDVTPAPAPVIVSEPAPRHGSYSSVAILTLGAGVSLAVLTAVAASIVGGVALSDASAAHSVCPASTCSDASAISQNNTALTLADWSTGLFVTSGVLLVTAVVVFFAIPPSRPSHGVALRPILSPLGMGLAGTF